MGMKRNKMILVILIGVLVIGTGIVGVFHLIAGDDSTLVTIGGYELTLTEEQYQRFKNSTLYEKLEVMNSIERRNVWLFLKAVQEEKLIDYLYLNHITHVARVLYLLNMGMIQDFKVIDYNWQIRGSSEYLNPRSGWFIDIRFISENGEIHHLSYSQTWGMQRITKECENGEILYHRMMNAIVGGRICEREYLHDIFICDKE